MLKEEGDFFYCSLLFIQVSEAAATTIHIYALK